MKSTVLYYPELYGEKIKIDSLEDFVVRAVQFYMNNIKEQYKKRF